MLCKSFSCFLLSCNINALQSIFFFVAFTVLLEIAFPAPIFITCGTDNLSFTKWYIQNDHINHMIILRDLSQNNKSVNMCIHISSVWITIYINIEYPLNPFSDTLRNPDTLTKFLLLECTIYFQFYSYLCS